MRRTEAGYAMDRSISNGRNNIFRRDGAKWRSFPIVRAQYLHSEINTKYREIGGIGEIFAWLSRNRISRAWNTGHQFNSSSDISYFCRKR